MAKKLQIIETCRDTNERLKTQKQIEFHQDEEIENKLLNIYSDVKYQEIEGFGGAFTESASATLDKVTPKQRKEILRAYFDKEKGLGYNFCRTHINSCDYSVDTYTYDDVDGDFDLKHFSMERDTKSLIPMIKEAFSIAPDIKLYASPWSPPVWMKTNDELINGGKLKKECYDVWARYFVKYIKQMEEEGIKIWGVTVQNEAKAAQPWESCVYTAEDERDFVKEALGPVFEKNGLSHIKIIIWDHNKERIVDRSKVAFSDKEASKYIDGVGVHWYSGDHFEALNIAHELFPDKQIYCTEACVRRNDNPWYAGERYAYDIIHSFNNWMSAWTDWNLLLDNYTGPNHWREEEIEKGYLGVYWFPDAPIIADMKTGEILYKSSYYYMGHFSKYIKRGARRIGFSIYTPFLEVAAFENPDGQKVVIVLNRTNDYHEFNLRDEEGIVNITSKAHSILTLLY